MKKGFISIYVLIVIPALVFADIIYFKDGKTLDVMSAWMENGEARCKIAGVIIGFPEKDVERIEHIPIGRDNKSSIEKTVITPVKKNKILVYPETEDRTCYELRRSYGYCATLSFYGNKCNKEDNIKIPSRCENNIETDRGHKDGVALAYKMLGLRTEKEPRSIGVSYSQIMKYLSDVISMEEIKAYKGEHHFLGRTKDKMAILEIIGEKSNVSRTSLMIINPKDKPNIVQRNVVMLLRFLENTIPEWDNSSEWVTKGLKHLAKYPDDSVETSKGKKKLEMKLLKEIGAICPGPH